jgi:hypothetical protein
MEAENTMLPILMQFGIGFLCLLTPGTCTTSRFVTDASLAISCLKTRAKRNGLAIEPRGQPGGKGSQENAESPFRALAFRFCFCIAARMLSRRAARPSHREAP